MSNDSKTWADKSKAIDAKGKEMPDNVGLRIQAASTRRMAEREIADTSTVSIPTQENEVDQKWKETHRAQSQSHRRCYYGRTTGCDPCFREITFSADCD